MVRMAVLLAVVAGCAFDESGLAGAGDAGLTSGPDAAAGPAPDAAPGAPDTGTADANPGDAGCPPVILRARKDYDPIATWQPDYRFYVPDSLTFALPGVVEVSAGNAANHCSFLEWFDGGDRIECAYKGGAEVAHVDGDPTQTALGLTYQLVQCKRGQTRMFPACGGGNAGTVVPLAAGAPVTAFEVGLTVNGDSWEGPTEATAVLAGSCDPDQ